MGDTDDIPDDPNLDASGDNAATDDDSAPVSASGDGQADAGATGQPASGPAKAAPILAQRSANLGGHG